MPGRVRLMIYSFDVNTEDWGVVTQGADLAKNPLGWIFRGNLCHVTARDSPFNCVFNAKRYMFFSGNSSCTPWIPNSAFMRIVSNYR